MPTKDIFHEQVKTLLETEGWSITHVYKRFFKYPFIQTVVQRNQIPLLIYDTEQQEAIQWIR